MRKQVFLLVVIIVLGFSLRLYDIGRESLWLDEIASVKIAESGKSDFGSPPIYYRFLGIWMNFFGDSSAAIRFPSFIFSLCSVILVYLLGKEIFNEKIALLATFFMAISMFQVVYAQEARAYSLLLFLSLSSALFFMRIISKRRSLSDYVLYSTTIIIANYVHFLALFLIIIFNLVFLVKANKKESRRWWISQAMIILAIVPLLAKLLQVVIKVIYLDFRDIFYLLGISHALYYVASSLAFLFLLLVLFKFGNFLSKNRKKVKTGLIRFFSERLSKRNSFAVFIILFILSIIYLLSVKYLASPYRMFLFRYCLFLTPIYYLSSAFLIYSIGHKRFRGALIILAVITSIFSLSYFYLATTKEEWDNAATYLLDADTGDLILVDAGYMKVALAYYYKKEVKIAPLVSTIDQSAMLRNISSTIDSAEKLWLVQSHNWKTKDFYNSYLNKKYTLLSAKHFKDIVIYTYKSS